MRLPMSVLILALTLPASPHCQTTGWTKIHTLAFQAAFPPSFTVFEWFDANVKLPDDKALTFQYSPVVQSHPQLGVVPVRLEVWANAVQFNNHAAWEIKFRHVTPAPTIAFFQLRDMELDDLILCHPRTSPIPCEECTWEAVPNVPLPPTFSNYSLRVYPFIDRRAVVKGETVGQGGGWNPGKIEWDMSPPGTKLQVQLVVKDVDPNSLAWCFTSPNLVSMPIIIPSAGGIAMGYLGRPLYVLYGTNTGENGVAVTQFFPLQDQAPLLGRSFYFQWLVASNWVTGSTTPALKLWAVCEPYLGN